MRSTFSWLVLLIGLLCHAPPCPGLEQKPAVLLPEQGRLKTHVTTLASTEFRGRRGLGAEKARAYLIREFERLELRPLFPDGYRQAIPTPDPAGVLGENVGAKIEGTDPVLRNEYVILGTHFDHLGVRNGVIYPGADDNATGVAMMLEVARSLTGSKQRPRRTVLIVGFDLEESGLWGSRYFVEKSPVPLDKVKLFVTADMLGRALGGVCERDLFVLGAEHAPGLRPWIEAASRSQPVRVGQLGADLLVLDRSDYGPFRTRSIPFLFFTTGENPLYHRPDDVAETIDFGKLEAASRIVLSVLQEASDAERVPAWISIPDHPLAEALSIRDVFRVLEKNHDRLSIGTAALFMIRGAIQSVDGMEKRGKITPEERASLVRVVRVVLFTVL